MNLAFIKKHKFVVHCQTHVWILDKDFVHVCYHNKFE